MNPFGKYVDCINCGNELSNISTLTFQTPQLIECDFCGQKYPGLSARIRKVKSWINLLFLLLGIAVLFGAWLVSAVFTGFFALLPLLIIYYFALGYAVRRSVKF